MEVQPRLVFGNFCLLFAIYLALAPMTVVVYGVTSYNFFFSLSKHHPTSFPLQKSNHFLRVKFVRKCFVMVSLVGFFFFFFLFSPRACTISLHFVTQNPLVHYPITLICLSLCSLSSSTLIFW